MQEKQLDGVWDYKLTDEKAYIVGYKGLDARVEIPAQIEGYPVIGIGKKAFLSRKNLREIILPDTVEEVGDWAFAYCNGLAGVTFLGGNVRFGKDIFKECGRLERIQFRAASAGGEEGIAALMAAAVQMMDAYYLLDLAEAGSREWLAKWDARLLTILRTSDQEGYSRQVLCGEEDYGSTDLEAFMSSKRKMKVRLALLRLLHPQSLLPGLQRELEDFLRSLTKGGKGEETWLVVKDEYGDRREYYKLFTDLNCIHEGNYEEILADIGEEHPEMKAFFLRLREENRTSEDFFAALEL